jgi:methylmalonyl-CoA/ethylmalonyl-CoA epimerase
MPGYGDSTDTTLRPLGGRAPDQVAYVVEDLEEGARRLGRLFGVRRWVGWRYDAAYLPIRRFRGHPGNFETWGVVADFGPSLEVVAPLSGDSVYSEFLAEKGPGLHHVGFFTDSLEREAARLAELGLEEVQFGGGHGVDGDGKIGFFETIGKTGPYVEIIEPPARRHAPHFTWDV